MSIQEKTFQQWTVDDIRFELGITEKEKCQWLDDWLDATTELSDEETFITNRLLKKAKNYVEVWNEQELQTKFIAPITELVDFDNLEYYFSAFAERSLEATYNNIQLKGKVDWMVAIGKSNPHFPFFFIHEYKRQKGTSNDPKGQLVTSMLAAHILNQTPPKPTLFNPFPTHDKNMPVYGCYIIGRWWFFVVLYKNEYCESQPYDSIDPKQLNKIIAILKKQKNMIIDRLEKAKTNK